MFSLSHQPEENFRSVHRLAPQGVSYSQEDQGNLPQYFRSPDHTYDSQLPSFKLSIKQSLEPPWTWRKEELVPIYHNSERLVQFKKFVFQIWILSRQNMQRLFLSILRLQKFCLEEFGFSSTAKKMFCLVIIALRSQFSFVICQLSPVCCPRNTVCCLISVAVL